MNKIDIVDKNNLPTGQQSAIDNAMRRGLWHRGVHIIVCTTTGYVLMQKRSSSMMTHPGYLDISCGGYVDTGETPQQAAARELHEELGIRVSEDELQFITLKRKNHAFPSIHRHDRTFIYCYAVFLPDHHVDISHLQASEVERAEFISFAQARTLIRKHYIKGIGRIEPLYRFYSMLLRSAIQLNKSNR